MRPIDLIVQGRRVTEWSKWEEAEIIVNRSDERISISSSIDGVILTDEAYEAINSQLIENKYKPLRVGIKIGNTTLTGVIDASKAKWGINRMVVDIEIDELVLFERDVAGRMPRTGFNCVVALEREGDRGAVAASLASCLLLLYAIIREVRDLKETIANTAAHAAGGATGSVAAAIYKAAVVAIRIVFIATLAIALWNIIEELLKLLPAPKTTRALNLGEAIRDVVSAAGYSVVYPPALNKIWLVGDNIDTIEATELIVLASKLLNAKIYMKNRQLRFSLPTVNFPLHNIAFTEFYTINADEFAGYNLVSLARDHTDRFSNGIPHAAEIRFAGYAGYNRVDIPYSPGKVKTSITELDRIVNIFYDTIRAAARILRRDINRNALQTGLLLVGNEYFAPKIVMADSLDRLNEQNETALLRFVAANYIPKLCRVYQQVRLPFVVSDYANLSSYGFPGVKSLRWNINSDYAEVDYYIVHIIQPDNKTERLI
jgi:hypothetical protein